MTDKKLLHFHYLQWLCFKGWGTRDIPTRAKELAEERDISYDEAIVVYQERLNKELSILYKLNFVDYILVVYDLYNFVNKNNILSSPSRGSAGSSVVCYLVGITGLDPVYHNLLFERFINPNRVDMPDIDMDFEKERREEIFEYIYKKYGEENVAQISTTMKLKGKVCLKDVARVFDVSHIEANKVTSAVIMRNDGDDRVYNCLEDSFEEIELCKKFGEKYPDIVKYSTQIEGLSRQVGIHAAGVIASPVPITDIVPIETRVSESNGKKVKVTALNKDEISGLGLLKLDVLGLNTLSMLRNALNAVKIRHGKNIDLGNLRFNDFKVFKNFTEQNYVGIFQFDSSSVRKIFEGVEFESFDDIVAINALNRPGTVQSGYAENWVLRKKGKQKIEKVHPVYDEVTMSTKGVLVYQEQINEIFIKLGNYDPGDADLLRKKISKSKGVDAIEKERESFVNGAVLNDCSEEIANDLISKIAKFGKYSFNKIHSTGYGVIAYWCMWLKVYYPIEFIWALLKTEDEMSQISRYVKEAKRLGCTILPPNVNTSGKEWRITEDNCIEASLLDVKGVGDKAVDDIIGKRKLFMEFEEYKDIGDFISGVDSRVVHRGVLEALAKAGALRHYLPNVRAFIENISELQKIGKYCLKEYENYRKTIQDYSDDDKQVLMASVCPITVGQHPLEIYEEIFQQVDDNIVFESTAEPDWSEKFGWFKGQIVEVKYNKTYGYAHVHLEDETGVQQRIKVSDHKLVKYKWILDKGYGACIIVACAKMFKSQTMQCVMMFDLETIRQELKTKTGFKGEAKCLKQHPVLINGGKKAHIRKLLAKKASKKNSVAENIVGWVFNVREHVDKNGNKMAFFDITGAKGSVGCLCFASSYEIYEGKLFPDTIVKLDLKRGSRKDSWFLDFEAKCRIKILEKL